MLFTTERSRGGGLRGLREAASQPGPVNLPGPPGSTPGAPDVLCEERRLQTVAGMKTSGSSHLAGEDGEGGGGGLAATPNQPPLPPPPPPLLRGNLSLSPQKNTNIQVLMRLFGLWGCSLQPLLCVKVNHDSTHTHTHLAHSCVCILIHTSNERTK